MAGQSPKNSGVSATTNFGSFRLSLNTALFTPLPGSEFVMPADAVIMAFGFHPHGMPWLESVGVQLDSRGRIKASVESRYRYQTTHDKIFAGGDAVRGADLVVTAMAEGRHAAQGIMDYLGVKSALLH